MKNSITLLITLLISIASFAQTDQTKGINYKALIKDDNGNVMSNQNLQLKFTIFEIDPEDQFETTHYQEVHTTTTNANGMVIVNIGNGEALINDFDTVNWYGSSDPIELRTEIDLEPYDDYVLLGTTFFQSVPYALFAFKTIGHISTLDDLFDAKSNANGTSLFLGQNAGANDFQTSGSNLGVGRNALYRNEIGDHNTAIGYNALDANISGDENTAIGSSALSANTTSSGNTAIGYYALQHNTGSGNTATGSHALRNNDTGNTNIANGDSALRLNETGDSNTAIGYRSGYYHLGSRNVFIGYYAGEQSSSTENDKLYINNTASSSPLIYGEFDTDLIRINGVLEVTEEINADVINTEEINTEDITTDIINADVINTEEIHTATTGTANLIPIAYGIVESTGNVLSGTGNFTAFLSGNVFVIDVNGSQSLEYGNTVCLITPITTSPRTASTIITDSNGDGDKDLNVRIFNESGTQVTTTFQFVIYKL